jgi:hypothetical protein
MVLLIVSEADAFYTSAGAKDRVPHSGRLSGEQKAQSCDKAWLRHSQDNHYNGNHAKSGWRLFSRFGNNVANALGERDAAVSVPNSWGHSEAFGQLWILR